MTLCRLLVPLALLLFVSVPARASEPGPLSVVPRPRLFMGPMFESIGSSNLRIDGRRQANEVGDLNLGQMLSYSQGLLPYFGFMAIERFSGETTEWAEGRAEARTGLDVAAGPELWLFPNMHGTFVDVRLALPVGASLQWFRPTPGSFGATDRYSTGTGWNLSALLGMDVMWRHHGIAFDLGYLGRWTTLSHSATLDADPSVHAVERYRYAQQSTVIDLAYVYRF